MRYYTVIKYVLLLAALVSICNLTQARELRFERMKNNLTNNMELEVRDDHYQATLDNSGWLSDFGYKSVNSWVKLKAEPHYGGSVIAPYTATVQVLIKRYNAGSLVPTQVTHVLSVKYSPTSGFTTNDIMDNESQINLNNSALRINVKIVSCAVVQNGQSLLVAPHNLYLSAGIDVDRYFNFLPAASVTGVLNAPDIQIDELGNTLEIEVSWNEIYGAESYDLEWCFIDGVTENGTGLTGATLLDLTDQDFRHNSTRVNITNQHTFYRIPFIYPRGYIIYRIRGRGAPVNVGVAGEIIAGIWSSDHVGNKSFISDWPNFISMFQGFQESLGKQVALSYIENGRRKEIVTYYDGTSRDRQILTRSENISDTVTVVAESMYDFLGRKVLNFLPAPDYNGSKYSSRLSYVQNFNLNQTGQPYSAGDFDKNPLVGSCAPSAQEALSADGAAKYYGNAYEQTAENNLWNRFVPDGEGYPFSIVEYTRDQTGRPKSQGGVGPLFQPGTGTHFTKMFYGAADQADLDKLFGYEVGYQKFYRKNMTVDPNGQASFTYTDPAGRTIATSLSGDAPPNMDPLNPSLGSVMVEETDLLGNLGGTLTPQLDLDTDANFYTSNGMALTYSGNYLSPTASNGVTLEYEMVASSYTDPCVSQSYPFKYKLDIGFYDLCGEDLFDGAYMDLPVPDPGLSWSLNEGEVNLAEIGEYGIYKNLRIDEDVMYTHLASYIEDAISYGICITDSSSIAGILESMAEITMNCSEDCDLCEQNVNAAFGLNEITEAQRDVLLAECQLQCQGSEPLSPCQTFYDMMLADVSPYGQYGDPSGYDPTSVFLVRISPAILESLLSGHWYDIIPITDPDNQYKNPDGTDSWIDVSVDGGVFDPPVFNENVSDDVWMGNAIEGYKTRPFNLLNVEDFLAVFQPSWTKVLVKFHPEHCLYEYCQAVEGTSANLEFIQDLNYTSWELLSPTPLPDGIIPSSNYSCYQELVENDPFWTGFAASTPCVPNQTLTGEFINFGLSGTNPFVASGGLASLSLEFKDRLENYLTVISSGGTVTTYSLNQVVAMYSECGGNYGFPGCFLGQTGHTINTDEERSMLRDLYLGVRTVFIQRAGLRYALANGCFNECIGNPNEMTANELAGLLSETSLGTSVCNGEYSWYFGGKMRRYGFPAGQMDVPLVYDANAEGIVYPYGGIYTQGAQQVNQLTGLCPMEFELVNFLRDLIETHHTFGARTGNGGWQIIQLESGNDNYFGLTPALHEAINPGGVEGNYGMQASVAGSVLTYHFVPFGTNPTPTCSISFDLESTPLTWGTYSAIAVPNTWRIDHLLQYSFYEETTTEEFVFHLTASVVGATGVIEQVVLKVTTCIDLRDGCDFTQEYCQETGLAAELVELLNALIAQPSQTTLNSAVGAAQNLNGFSYLLNNGPISNYLGIEANLLQYLRQNNNVILIGKVTTPGPRHYIRLQHPNIASVLSGWSHIQSVVPSANSSSNLRLYGYQSSNNLYTYIDLIAQRVLIPAVGATPQTYEPILFNCAESADCIPEEDELDPLDLVEMLTYYIGNGNSGPGGSTVFEWTTTMPGEPYSTGLTEGFWLSNFITTLWFDPDRPKDENITVLETQVWITETIIEDEDGNPTGESGFQISIYPPTGTPGDTISGCDFDIEFLSAYSNPLLDPTNSQAIFQGFNASLLENGNYDIYPDPSDPHSFIFTSDFTGMFPPYQYGNYTYRITSTCVEFDFFGCDDCVDDPVPANLVQSCHAAYDDYDAAMITYVDGYTQTQNPPSGIYSQPNENGILPLFPSESAFCHFGLGPRVQQYIDYLAQITDLIDVTKISYVCSTSDDPDFTCLYYVSIEEFVAGEYHRSLYTTPGTGGQLTYFDFIEAIKDLSNSEELFMTLAEFHGGGFSNYCLANYLSTITENTEIDLSSYCSSNGELPNPVTYCPQYQTPTTSLVNLVQASGVIEGEPGDVLTQYCADLGAEITGQNTWHIMENQIQTLTQNFISNYMQMALSSVKEMMTRSGSTFEQHYTLYYYDKVGNLIKTVSPQGVNTTNPPNPATVATDRDAGVRTTGSQTSHTLATVYKYNTLNNLVYQNTPDGGETRFYYDKLGRLIASQNAKQNLSNHYSYTTYDALGRIIESGQLEATAPPTGEFGTGFYQYFPTQITWPGMVNGSRTEMVHTSYDESPSYVATLFAPDVQTYLRNRVATVAYIPLENGDVEHATHYSYDIHGNVKLLLQEFPDLEVLSQNVKKIAYKYDLISGSVKEVAYQPGKNDQFSHRYFYDSQNRITRATTSDNTKLWQEDARYYYYAHGPLARMELAENQVQGVDHFYTLQGWLKGVNSDDLSAQNDVGHDGLFPSNRQKITTGDAFGYSLHYFDGDYTSRKTFAPGSGYVQPIANYISASTNGLPAYDLFNGNISRMSTTIYASTFGQDGYIAKTPQTAVYRYDQLNRIKSAKYADGFNSVTNTWNATLAQKYKTDYTYDANGNILTLNRNGNIEAQPKMDNLVYDYTAGRNRLRVCLEAIQQSVYDNDLPYFPTYDAYILNPQNLYDLYEYDAIGNLTTDHREFINISWLVNGKIKDISRYVGHDIPDINFTYDPMGNRVTKLLKTRTGNTIDRDDKWSKTYYVRDAQGNVLATYERLWIGKTTSGWSNKDILRLREHHIYGSSRLAVTNENREIASRQFNITHTTGTTTTKAYQSTINTPAFNPNASIYTLGKKHYELSNHLGNVLSVISDNIWVNGSGGNTVNSFSPDIVAANDYYPFGMQMPGRSYNSGDYRYGFGSHEKDDEVKGSGNHLAFGDYGYDPRTGKRWTVDKMASQMPNWSPYAFGKCNPILYIDADGLFPYTFHIRAFAPTGSFKGSGFHDDGRGYSTRTDVTSRIKQQFTVDPTARTFSGGTPTSDPTHWNGMDVGTATNTGGASAQFGSNSFGSSTASINSNFEGSNPAPIFMGMAPAIEVSSAISVTENLKTNQVFVSIDLSSKQFPATEGLMQDNAGNSILLAGAAAYGTAANLARADKEKIASVDLIISINDKGVFQNVTMGGQTYSLEEFNKLGTDKPAGPLPRADKDKGGN